MNNLKYKNNEEKLGKDKPFFQRKITPFKSIKIFFSQNAP